MSGINFSFIVPTRNRLPQLRLLMESIRATTNRLDALEVILIVDRDDPDSLGFSHPEVIVKHVEVQPGLPMSALNQAGYAASSGRYVMLLNDDVILRTPGWDDAVFRVFHGFPDGVCMVHVNDLIFRDSLCTFPCLPRNLCILPAGILPSGYVRYRIDDHIHNVFDLLAILGAHRRVFLPDVVFEHTNSLHSANGSREYMPDPAIHQKDTLLFDALLPERRKAALWLRETIDSRSLSGDRQARMELLDSVTDSVAVREPENARWIRPRNDYSNVQARVTIALMNAGLNSFQARRCIELVRAYTANYTLTAVDTSGGSAFNPGRERNRALSACQTDFLVLMENSAGVGPGWLDSLLAAFDETVGAVAAGGILLVDLARCGHLRFDEKKTAPALQQDFAQRVRGANFRLMEMPAPAGPAVAGLRQVSPSPVPAPYAAEIRRLREKLRNHEAAIARLADAAAREQAGNKRETEEVPEPLRIAYPLFDADYYREQTPEIAVTGADSLAHFLKYGGAAKSRPNPLFDSRFYLDRYPDVAAAGANPLLHFLQWGAAEGRQPHPLFDPSFYLSKYPDAAQSGMNPLAHFLEFGAIKAYSPCALFDTSYYLRSNPDVAASGVNPVVHFLEHGAFEGRNPNPHFFSAFYLSRYPDVAETGMNPLVHFIEFGHNQGRAPNPLFDVQCYRLRNPDVASAGMNTLEHFLTSGIQEKRNPSLVLNFAGYMAQIESANGTRELDRSARPYEPAETRASSSPRPASASLVPLSVVIPTHNRADLLRQTLEACSRHTGGCEIEFIVIDDGSSDHTVSYLRDAAARMPNLSWQAIEKSGPGRARNIGVDAARYDVILFLGDDIRPINDDFFRVHASLHARHQETEFAVLGKVIWPTDSDFPVNPTMIHIQEKDGTQFDYPNITPYTFTDWRHFYTSNLSLKKRVVRDWLVEGFDTGFPAAAMEDMELGYRIWKSSVGLRVLYDPGSVAAHYHHYTVDQFMDRQVSAGKSLKYLLDLHPEAADRHGVNFLLAALRQPPSPRPEGFMADIASLVNAIKAWARILENRSLLGREGWHEEFLSALFQLSLFEGFVSAWPRHDVNTTAAWAAILDHFLFRMGPALQHGFLGLEYLEKGAIPTFASTAVSAATPPKPGGPIEGVWKKGVAGKLAEATLFENELQPWRTSPKPWNAQFPIPSMICSDEIDFLYFLANRHYRGDGVMVDFGPLAGASTYALASGAPQATIHSYDFWRFTEGFTVNCFPGKLLREDDDLLPLFLENIAPFRDRVVAHQGDLNQAKWHGQPIELLFIDAAKSPESMVHIVREFFPNVIPGGWIIFQDYVSATCPWIHIMLEELSSYFEYYDSPSGGTVVTRVVQPVPHGALPRAFFDHLPLQRARMHLQRARTRLVSWEHLCVWLAEADYLACAGEEMAAREIVRRVKADPRFIPANFEYDLQFLELHLAEHRPLAKPHSLPIFES